MPTIDRILIVTCKQLKLCLVMIDLRFDYNIYDAGLLKDFGWMTTNVFLAIPFGIISVLMHVFLLFFDPRRSYRFYNISLLLWVCGNFIWMAVELMNNEPSSQVHVGPNTPIGYMSDNIENTLVNVKTILFLFSSIVQLFMYLLICYKCIETPEDEEEDIVSKNEAVLFFFGQKSYAQQNEGDILDQLDDDDVTLTSPNHAGANPYYGLTLALIENAYIIFWVSKDLFWSWGTGDLTKGRDLAIMYEAFAMCFGSLSIFTYCLSAYLYRRNLVRLLDCITTIFWISANFVWMSGEFFLRYDNLELDDGDQGDDGKTRIVSSILFCLGILLQLYVIVALYLPPNRYTRCLYNHVYNKKQSNIEMMNMKVPIRYSNLMVTYAPQQGTSPMQSHDPFEGDEAVLF